ncbi:hypothetical protein BC833DRAFT_330288 [Globomyces pollinis-pini]|nr:hypothetical protein BC833DRAFT_330288 [Globomyces pollinis-pini]
MTKFELPKSVDLCISPRRGLKARHYIPKGTLVLTDKAIATTTQNCSNCFQTGLLKCSRCITKYCSVECQRLDWKIHKLICSHKEIQPEIEMLIKVQHWYHEHGDDDNQKSILCTLESNLSKFNQTDLDYLELQLKRFGKWNNESLQLLCTFQCNNFTIYDHELFEYGQGTFPLASLINHSCEPNVVALFKNDSLFLKSLVDIQEGDELFISYVDCILPITDRIQSLSKYQFVCDCQKCLNEQQITNYSEPLDNLQIFIQEMIDSSNPVPPKIVIEFIETLMSDYQDTSKTNLHESVRKSSFYRFSYSKDFPVVTKLFYDFMDLQKWNKASILSRFICAVYQYHYPQNHPMIGLQLYITAKCLWNAYEQNLSKLYIKYARQSLTITHGDLFPQFMEEVTVLENLIMNHC